ncbi:hypothetical protein HPB50_000974 [Hyalomma asiaticum]|uniref:Uncharacterized protein n=1 Tax=Hyalomma asiaticum TaxID=266040 RepID=A0ACB7TCK0_HYAAI|nr:hypothetical protein HPB50_000974 [Hyalomma asiaticum]
MGGNLCQGDPCGATVDEWDTRDNLTSYNDLVKAFYLSRRVFPPPHPKLSRAQATTLRLLQTDTYPSPARLHLIFPDVYPTPNCRCCGTHPATLPHMLWECPAQVRRRRTVQRVVNLSSSWHFCRAPRCGVTVYGRCEFFSVHYTGL